MQIQTQVWLSDDIRVVERLRGEWQRPEEEPAGNEANELNSQTASRNKRRF